MKRTLICCSLLLPTLSFAQQLTAAWPQYRGPNGDGSTKEVIAKPWSSEGPKSVWKQAATQGFSSIAVGGGLAVTLMTRETEGVPTETCVAWDAATGKEQWAFPLKIAKYDGGGDSGGKKGDDGPRSTPSLAPGKVFVLGANLDLYCLDAKSGKALWKVDLIADFKAQNVHWQSAASPILEGNLCIVMCGGKGQSFIAFDQATGKPVWKAEDDAITQATPTVATIHGIRQIIFFTQKGLAALDLKGKLLWRQDYSYKTSTAASPIVWQDIVYCSAGYGVGAGAFKISKTGFKLESTQIWRTEGKNINHWSTPVCKDGYLYGLFGFKEYGKCPLACVDIRTGEMKWQQEGFGPGNTILSGDQLLVLSDKGELVLAAAKPDAYKEIARADVLDGKCWSTPTLAGGYIFARSTEQAGCFELAH